MLSVVVLAACAVGRKIDTVPAVITAHGVQGSTRVADRTFTGEVMTATDSSIVMLTTEGRLVEIPADHMRRVDFRPFLRQETRPTPQDLARLLRVSRFPYGIPDVALRELLTRSNQSMIERIAP
jgi:hypothetical protein